MPLLENAAFLARQLAELWVSLALINLVMFEEAAGDEPSRQVMTATSHYSHGLVYWQL